MITTTNNKYRKIVYNQWTGVETTISDKLSGTIEVKAEIDEVYLSPIEQIEKNIHNIPEWMRPMTMKRYRELKAEEDD